MGPAIIAAKGYAAPEVAPAYHRVLELCENLGDTERQFSVLLGLTLFHYVRADLPLLRRLADQLMELAKIQTESGCDLAAERTLGYVLANLGELEVARTKFDHVVASYDYAMHGTFAARRGGSDFGVDSLIYGGWVMSMLGHLDQARDRYATALQLARQLEHPISEAFAHWAAACIHLVRHEPKTALKCIQFAADIAEEKEFPQYRVWTMLVRGMAHFQLGAYPEAIAEIQKGLDASQVIGSVLINSFWMANLASALGRNGQV
jgi:tetratricopeptide (TPR) repeat protein